MSKNNSVYRNIKDFGQNMKSDATNPLTYCINSNTDQRFLHGADANYYGQYSRNCQAFLADYCAQGWDAFCENAAQNVNISYPNHLEFSIPNMSAGDILIRNAAIRKYLKKMDGNCIRTFEPFDPQVADSPLIYFWDIPSNLNYVSKCLPCFSVDPHTIDKDPIMDKLLQNPRIGLDILINIHNTMYKEGNLHKLRGTKLGGFLQLYKANVMRK
jgi:hypothetical protein